MVVLGIISLSGLLFWILAAANYTDDDVGRAAAWYTLIQLVVIGSAFGAPIIINRTGGSERAAVTTGATLATVAALALPAALVAPLFAGSEWRTIGSISGLTLSGLMALLVLGSASAILVDARLVSLRRWRWLFVRAAVPSVIRVLALLVDPWDASDAWIVTAAAGPVALSGLVGVIALWRSGSIQAALPQALNSSERRFFLVQHLGAVATQLPYHVVPFLVARQVAGRHQCRLLFRMGHRRYGLHGSRGAHPGTAQ